MLPHYRVKFCVPEIAVLKIWMKETAMQDSDA